MSLKTALEWLVIGGVLFALIRASFRDPVAAFMLALMIALVVFMGLGWVVDDLVKTYS